MQTTLILTNTKGKIVGLIDKSILKKIDMELSYEINGYQFMVAATTGWDGRCRLLDKKLQFPIGLASRVKSILDKESVDYKVVDNRIISKNEPLTTSKFYQPRDYQKQTVDAAAESFGGIVQISVGGGKSVICAQLVARLNMKTVVYVPGVELLYSTKKVLENAIPSEKIGIVGDGQCDIQKITVCTIWTAASSFDEKIKLYDNDTQEDKKAKKFSRKQEVKDMVQSAECIIIDEGHYATDLVLKFLHAQSVSAAKRYIFSATPWREEGDELLVEAICGPKLVEISSSWLIERGYLVQPRIYFLKPPKNEKKYSTYQDAYSGYIVHNESRNKMIVKAAKKLIDAGRSVLILFTRIDHGKNIGEILEEENLEYVNLDGSDSSERRLEVMKSIDSGDVKLVLASRIFDMGVDMPKLSALILAGSGKSKARTIQRVGRVIRTGPKDKKDAVVVDFEDDCKWLDKHSKLRREVYKTEKMFDLKS